MAQRSELASDHLAAQIGLRESGCGLVIAACSQTALTAALSRLANSLPGARLLVVLDARGELYEGRAADLARLVSEGRLKVGARFAPTPGLLAGLRRRRFDVALALADEERSPSRWAQAVALLAGASRTFLLLSESAALAPVSLRSLATAVATKVRAEARETLAGVPLLGPALALLEQAGVWGYQSVCRPPATAAALAEARVLLVRSGPGASTRYRIDHKQEQLRMLGMRATARSFRDYLARPLLAARDAGEHDVAIVHRLPRFALTCPLLTALIRAGRPVAYDIDDLIFEPEALPWVPPLAQRAVADQARLLSHCTHVIAATSELAARAARHQPATYVVGNVLSQAVLAASRRASGERNRGDTVRLGYLSGSPTHDQDIATIAPAVAEVLRRRPQAELVLVGPVTLPPELAGLERQVRALPLVPWRDLPRLMAQAIDINLVPLDLASPFCRSKSEIKYLEAGAVGMPTVATPIPAFAQAITHGVTGFLAETPEQWVEALGLLTGDAALRRDMGEAARRDVEQRYSPQRGAQRLAETLGSILGLPPAG